MEKKQKRKKSKLKVIFIIMAIIIALAGLKYFQIKKQTGVRRAVMQEQRQVLIESWHDQGLSEEEIQEKLKTQRSEMFSEDGNRSMLFGVMRMFRGGGRSGGGQRPEGGFH